MAAVSRRTRSSASSAALAALLPLRPDSASLPVGDHEPALCCLCHAVALCAAGLAFARRGFDMSPARWPLLASPPALLPLHLQSAPPSADGRKRTVLPAWGCAQRRGERVTCADNMFTAPLTLCVSPCASRAGGRMRRMRTREAATQAQGSDLCGAWCRENRRDNVFLSRLSRLRFWLS